MRQSFSTCVYCMQLRFQKKITLVWANQSNFFENATTCSKRMRKTLVATQLNSTQLQFIVDIVKALIHTRRFGTQYCDKILRHRFLLTNQGKLWKNIPWFIKDLTLADRDRWPKNIFLSQYCVRKWLMWIRLRASSTREKKYAFY